MTIDEELNLLDESVRRLKIEYDVYFGGGAKRPPTDTEWRVQSLIKRHADNGKLNFAQRFRYNGIAQKYAIFSDLWRQKLKIKEEGYRRPQDAILGIQGLRTEPSLDSEVAERSSREMRETEFRPFSIDFSDTEREAGKLQALYDALLEAKKLAGGTLPQPANFDAFKDFVQRKTEQIRNEYGCHSVEYCVEMQDRQVKLKARAKV